MLAFQCAKQTSPTGGPTDETPPTLVMSTPRHEQTNVKNTTIELEFDEAIQLNNPREQIIITPRVDKKFETTFNKRKVTLNLNSELQENTTYNINFREAIQDLTEKNPATVKLAFSTGSYIDSLSVNGTVQDALTEKRLAGYTVALAEASDTFNIFKHPASWVTVTDKKGFFSIENLKPGNYTLYAFDDKSKNLMVDSKSESYGFMGNEISLAENVDSVRLRTFKLDINNLKLLTARTTFAYYNLRFSKSLVDYHIAAVDSSIDVQASLEPDLTTVKLYNTVPALDSVQIRVTATDSLGSAIDTLLYMKFPKKEATRDKFTAKPEKITVNESNEILTGSILFNKPVVVFNRDS
ncbi:MAG TPA: Ig-like domain-containing domain, partial [Cyclobacteriaceae bacterium]|nr:Ig-like domain-containing domain [Cyclobacteriaceae bacterium]